MSKKVFIEVGHGGKELGAIFNGLMEKDIALTVSLETDRVLRFHGVNSKLSRYLDETETLSEAIKEEKLFKSDLAVGIHINAGEGKGFECFHHSKGEKSKLLGRNIEREILSLGQNSRGLKTKVTEEGAEYYGWIRETYGTAVILELAFIDNLNGIKIIDEEKEQKLFGQAIAKGILKHLNIPFNIDSINSLLANIKEPLDKEENNRVYRLVSGSFNYLENAKLMQSELKVKEIDSWIDSTSIKGYYRVIIGSYKDYNNAKVAQGRFRKVNISSYII